MGQVLEMPKADDPLIGRLVQVNEAMGKVFYCGGFHLGPGMPSAHVPPNAQLEPIRRALADGRLIDVTDVDPSKGVRRGGNRLSKVQETDTGKTFLIGQDKHGNRYFIAPKDADEAARFDEEIRKTKTLKLDYQKDVELDVAGLIELSREEKDKLRARLEEPGSPDLAEMEKKAILLPSPGKKKAHGRTSSRKRQPKPRQ